jgi:RNA polymerase sigma factor for flagellar operon FliA
VNRATTALAERPLVAGMTRDEACRHYQPKVLAIARRLHDRLSAEVRLPLDDLAAVGAMGLLEAFDRFDPGRDVLFSTFAEYRIRGAMYDAIRENDTCGRRRRQLAKRVGAATEDLRRELGRAARPAEVARRLEISLDEYHAAVDATKPVVAMSLDEPGEEGALSLSERLADPNVGAEARLVARDTRRQLKQAIAELPDRQRQCVLMYYGSELSLVEIALVLDVTMSRVSQILTEARARLKKKLQATVDRGDLEARS